MATPNKPTTIPRVPLQTPMFEDPAGGKAWPWQLSRTWLMFFEKHAKAETTPVSSGADAPNVLGSTTIQPYYCDAGGDESAAIKDQYGFKGVIQVDPSDPNYGHLVNIYVVMQNPSPDDHIGDPGWIGFQFQFPVAGALDGSIPWKSGPWARPESSATFQKAMFLCANEDGSIAPDPFFVNDTAPHHWLTVVGMETHAPFQVTAVTVDASVVGVDAAGNTKVNIVATYTPPSGVWDAYAVGLWLTRDDGTTWEQIAADLAGANGNTIGQWVDRPLADQDACRCAVVAWRQDWWLLLDIPFFTAAGEWAGMQSLPFTLLAPAPPHPHDITDAILGAVTYPRRDDGTSYWTVDVAWTNPTLSTDVEFLFSYWSVQKTDSAGVPADDYEGTERKINEQWAVGGLVTDLLLGVIPPDPDFSRYVFRLYVVNRKNVATLQTTAWTGADSAIRDVAQQAFPDAPNVLGTSTCVPYYCDPASGTEVTNGSEYGFKGVINLPADVTGLKKIVVNVIDPGGGVHPVYIAYDYQFAGSFNWKSDSYPRPEYSTTMASASFLCENADGHISAGAYSIPGNPVTHVLEIVGLPLNAPLQVTAVAASVIQVGVEAATGAAKVDVQLILTPPAGWDADAITAWLKVGSSPPTDVFSIKLSDVVANTVSFWVDRPAVDQINNCYAYVVAWKVGYYHLLDRAAAPASIKSNSFTLTAAGSCLTDDIADAALGVADYPVDASGNTYCNLPFSFTNPLTTHDVEWLYSTITQQKTDLAGTPASDSEGAELPIHEYWAEGDHIDDFVWISIPPANNPDGSANLFRNYRYRAYAHNKYGARVLQPNGWGAAVDHVDFVPDASVAPYDPSRMPTGYGTDNSGGVFSASTIGDNLVPNGDFEKPEGAAHGSTELENWTLTGSAYVETANVSSGRQCVSFAPSANALIDAIVGIPVISGTTYAFTFRALAQGADQPLEVVVGYRDKNKAYVAGNPAWPLYPADYPSWKSAGPFTFTVPTGVAYIALTFGCAAGFGNSLHTGLWSVDAVEVRSTILPAQIPSTAFDTHDISWDGARQVFVISGVDFGLAKPGTFSSQFSVVWDATSSTNRMTITALKADIISLGELEVGGIGNVSRIKIFKAGGTDLIGWFGDDYNGSGYDGGWLVNLAIGGNLLADQNHKDANGAYDNRPKIYLTTDGSVAINQGTFSLQHKENVGTAWESIYNVAINTAYSAGTSGPASGASFTGIQVARATMSGSTVTNWNQRCVLINRGAVGFEPGGNTVFALVSYNGDVTGGNAGSFYGILTLADTAGAIKVKLEGNVGLITAADMNLSGSINAAGMILTGSSAAASFIAGAGATTYSSTIAGIVGVYDSSLGVLGTVELKTDPSPAGLYVGGNRVVGYRVSFRPSTLAGVIDMCVTHGLCP